MCAVKTEDEVAKMPGPILNVPKPKSFDQFPICEGQIASVDILWHGHLPESCKILTAVVSANEEYMLQTWILLISVWFWLLLSEFFWKTIGVWVLFQFVLFNQRPYLAMVLADGDDPADT